MSDFTDHLKPRYDGASTLQAERDSSDIQATELAQHLLSRDGFLERQEKVTKVLSREKLFNKDQQMNLSRPERYHLGLTRAKAIQRIVRREGWDHEDYVMAEYLTDEMSPYHLHMTMFGKLLWFISALPGDRGVLQLTFVRPRLVTTILEQGSEQQKQYWMPRILSYDIIGCYAQSELGHGSNVRGLETTATWDPLQTDFEIHSPFLTASKWWNGSLGRTATHAIVVAQLLVPPPGKPKDTSRIGYENCGPQTFVVQIRDQRTHQPMDGIVVGDIGPKYSYASMDNGYMLFNRVRVPKSAMLTRYAEISDETGALNRSGHPAVVYGSLTFVRGQIIMHARLVLARAVTVAVRYCVVRRQFHDRDSTSTADPEKQVLDYPTVQIRILPLLAATFALHYTGEYMYDLYRRSRETIESGNFAALAELHSASSGLKSLCTTVAADGIETCRRAMGGHGFGGGSGLVSINADYLSKPTVEGDNWMITQQVVVYLIKKMASMVVKDSTQEPVEPSDKLFQYYLRDREYRRPKAVLNVDDLISDQAVVDAFQWRVADLSYRVYQARVLEKKPWTVLMIQLHNLSRAHSEQILVTTFHKALLSNTSSLHYPTPDVLRTCFRLFALSTLSSSIASFLLTNSLTHETLCTIDDAVLKLMAELRPHALNW